uniref:Uncharacterized protein n=1 Tax=Chelydra serpentina TaxID=8475 RepID=A0A8C3S6G8_CHESE
PSAGSGPRKRHRSTPWRPWTPPSIWADMVLFSNFSSPEYIMELASGDSAARSEAEAARGRPRGHGQSTQDIASGCCCSSPWRRASPSPGTSSASRRPRRNTRPGPPWWPPAGSPSSLPGRRGEAENGRR